MEQKETEKTEEILIPLPDPRHGEGLGEGWEELSVFSVFIVDSFERGNSGYQFQTIETDRWQSTTNLCSTHGAYLDFFAIEGNKVDREHRATVGILSLLSLFPSV